MRLEDLTALVEEIAPGGVVVGDAGVQHEVMVPPGHGKRVELDRSESAEDLEHCVRPSVQRARRRKCVARDEKTTCVLSSDPHRTGRYPVAGRGPLEERRRSTYLRRRLGP